MAGRLCVVGGGWAGIAAAVRAAEQGHHVTLLEMAPRLGGRARQVDVNGIALDNGQHILIGAYRSTLDLMRHVGVQPDEALERRGLELVYPDGSGLRLPPGRPLAAFASGVLAARGWTWADRLALLRRAASWNWAGFRCEPSATVSDLTERLPARVRHDLLEPLCVSALNTPADQASGVVFLRVLHDALFAGRGGADLLLPRRSLSALLPDPAAAWLVAAGADLQLTRRVQSLVRDGEGWRVDGIPFDAVVLASAPHEAARLTRTLAPAWAQRTASFAHEPIITIYFRSPGTRLPRPMTALRPGDDAPAQFLFDHGRLGSASDVFAAVCSGARQWNARGAAAAAEAVRRQIESAMPSGTWASPPEVLRVLIDKRGTFLCTPGLDRPPRDIAPALSAAGDYVDGPYPATLEGAVRSGNAAADAVMALMPSPRRSFRDAKRGETHHNPRP